MPATLPTAPGPLHHLAIAVSDLEASSHFYGELVGLRETLNMRVSGTSFTGMLRVPPDSRTRIRYFDGGPKVGQIELVEWSPGPADAVDHRDVRRTGAVILSFAWSGGIDGLVALHGRLESAGVRCWSPPTEIELENFGIITAFIAEDPDGVPIEFVALPSPDQVRDYRAAGGASHGN